MSRWSASSTPISRCICRISAPANALFSSSPRSPDAPDAEKHPGEVFVQTYTPFSPSIQFARHHDFAGYFRTGAGISRALRFSTVQTRHSDHCPLCTRRTRKIVCGNITAPLERSAAAGIHFGRSDPRAARKIARAIPLPHPAPRRSHHAFEPPGARNRRQIPFPEDVIVTVDVDPYQLL